MRIKVTLRYMGCIKETFTCESLYISPKTRRIYTQPIIRTAECGVFTGWTLDGNTSIETEPEEIVPISVDTVTY